MKTILVQMADKDWTAQALHLACALARNQGMEVVLLRLMQVQHISYLGSDFGDVPFTHVEHEQLREYNDTAEDYGVTLTLEQMQCIAPLEAVTEAAEALDAEMVFMRIPESRIPYLHQFQAWRMEQRIKAAGGRQLFTLDKPRNVEHAPTITVKPARSSM